MYLFNKLSKIISDYQKYLKKKGEKVQLGNPIFISGMQRSGTTWVANMLNVEGVRVYHEPIGKYSSVLFAPEKGFSEEEANEKIDLKLGHILSGNDYRHFNWSHPDHFERQTSGRFSPISLFGLKRGRVIIKDPLVIENLSYISKGRDIDFLLIQRSPLGYVSSLKKLNQVPKRRIKLLLFHDKFQRFNFKSNSYIKNKSIDDLSNIELFALQYNMLKVLQEEFINNTKNFIRVYKYEDLCIDSVSKFRSIFNEFGLRYDEKVRGLHHYLTKNQSQHGDFDYKKTMIRHYVKRNSEIYPDVWKNRLSEKEIQIIYEICDAFDST